MVKEVSRVPTDFAGFKAFVAAHDFPVLIFGADIVGKMIAELLHRHDVRLDYFVDNNKNKCGDDLCGVPVRHASELNDESRDAIVLIASTYIADLINQLEGLGFANWLPIAQIIEENRHEHLEEALEGSLRFNHAGGAFTRDFDRFVLENMVNSQKKYLDPNRLYIRSVDLIITERCSLKCKDCSNLMQFYEKPVDIGMEELMQDLDDLCAVADEINEIRIIGGDPFMNKDCHKIVKKAASYPNINKIVVYTNGVICPPEEKLRDMINDKTFIFITTYGALSKRAEQLSEMLKKIGIPYNIQDAYGWTDCGGIGPHERTEAERERIFKFCCAKNFTTMTGGKVYRCPFSANVERLQAVPDVPENYVDLRGVAGDGADVENTRVALRRFLRDVAYIPACDHCNGRTYGDPEIQPGIQTKAPLSYTKYPRPEPVA